MEIALLCLFFGIYLTIRFYMVDHDTDADKDRERFKKGIHLFNQSAITEAHTYFDNVVQQHPKSAIAYAYRGKCQLAQANYYSAIYDLTEALARVELRQLPQAENDLRRAIALGDENSFHLLLQPPFTQPVYHR
jgi:outer membrane protein assembly factor BamD (BamD/ComL family)